MTIEETLKVIETACTGFVQLLGPYRQELSSMLAKEWTDETTAEQYIARYLQLKLHFEAINKTLNGVLVSDKSVLEAIQDRLLVLLTKTGADSVSCDSGTAYKSTLLSGKVTDRERFLDWCLDRWEGIGSDMMQIGAPKVEALRRYLQENGGDLPAGVETSTFTRINVRAS
jgi:hypothetical protein